ncbi:MAG: L-histidine N(alpha)-methyltransferase [Deltaproteobacteria bacterium]|nr:L-histidine N(alpha)-methyltransferase [Nannocystaceae bacterium]
MRPTSTSIATALTPVPVLLHDDAERERARFLDEVRRGLSRTHKTLPTEFLYDARGSQLFDAICELPEYYPTRTELAIMREHMPAIAAALGSGITLVEYGSGSSLKTRLLLDELSSIAAYVPVDISREHLMGAAASLRREFPGLRVEPVCADFTSAFDVPVPRSAGRRVVYFPGSTIGNFEPEAAAGLLRQMARIAGDDGGLLVGVDLRKPVAVLEPAYNDAAGVTAAFNLNLLRRIDRELGGDFDLSRFEHRAYFDEQHGRIVMTLVSRCAQLVTVGGQRFRFAEGETIRTEYSHKYTLEGFAALAGQAGLRVEQVWTDPQQWFSVQLLRR